MFAELTVNDFLAMIDWHVAKALDLIAGEVARVRSDANKAGALNSRRAVLFAIQSVRKEFDVGIESVLGELKWTIRKTKLDPTELRQQAVQRLTNFSTAAKSRLQIEKAGEFHQHLAAFDEHLEFMIRQFDVGLIDPAEPEVPPVTNNSINIGTMTGSAIQQGSHGSKQSVDFRLDVQRAVAALNAFEKEMQRASLDEKQIADLTGDLATIKAQLAKPAPSLAILREAGQSVRNISEGIAAGVLTSPLLTAAAALGAAVGLH